MRKYVKIIKAFVPYAAVLIGLYWLSSAWAAVMLYHAGALALSDRAAWAHARKGWRPSTAVALSALSLAAPVSILLLWRVAVLPDLDLQAQLATWGLDGWRWAAFFVYFSLVHPVIEEVFWRGSPSPREALLRWQDFAFAGYHALVLARLMNWPWVVVAVGVLVGASALWRYAAARTGGIGSVVLAHAVADLGVLVAAVWIINGAPQWL